MYPRKTFSINTLDEIRRLNLLFNPHLFMFKILKTWHSVALQQKLML